jgi:hypothetical protein
MIAVDMASTTLIIPKSDQRLSVVCSAVDKDDYVIEDKESMCLGEASGQTMLDRPTLHAMEGQSLSTS